jgi:putative tricarboxylic transport membrane protein
VVRGAMHCDSTRCIAAPRIRKVEKIMRRVSLVMSLVFTAAGVFMIYGGYTLKLKGQYGPGPGFTAFWIGVPLTVLSLVWLGQLCLRWRGADEPFISERGGLRRVIAVLGALCAFGALLMPLGFDLCMMALLLFLFFAFNREHVVLKIVIAIAGSFGVHYAFEHYLRVPLPYAGVDFLRALGL